MGRLKRQIPDWIKFALPAGGHYSAVRRSLKKSGLHTVCTEARCPNIGECFSAGTATFLILGNICTRNCRYCSVPKGLPLPPDEGEPGRVAEAAGSLGLSYTVITSVTRDDLPDGGAALFAASVEAVREKSPHCGVELLIPDFGGDIRSLRKVLSARPGVVGHNIEVVKRLFPGLRPLGDYARSLEMLERIAASGIPAKSGLMVGFGEDYDDIGHTLDDLYRAGCRVLTVGQYLRSSRDGFPVEKFYSPEEFDKIRGLAQNAGFGKVLAGPLVRSSYHAGEMARHAGKESGR